jgi:acyl carrier protein
MGNSPAVLDDVRQMIAEVLALDLEEVTAAALFFDDLGGESIDLLELSFRFERHLGVRVRFNDFTANIIELDDEGRLTPSSLALLKARFPFLKLEGFDTRPLARKTDLLTVEAIAGFVQAALDTRDASPAAKL